MPNDFHLPDTRERIGAADMLLVKDGNRTQVKLEVFDPAKQDQAAMKYLRERYPDVVADLENPGKTTS